MSESVSCPLTACPRTFKTKETAREHCKSLHGVSTGELTEFNQTYEPERPNIRVSPHSVGTIVEFRFVDCTVCGETRSIPERQYEQCEYSYCSAECQKKHCSRIFAGQNHPSWKDTPRSDYYGPNWQEQRERRIKQDGDQCRECGLTRKKHQEIYNLDLHVHHIVPRSQFRDGGRLNWRQSNQLTNLITLCNSCHARHEHKSPEFFGIPSELPESTDSENEAEQMVSDELR